MPPSVYMTRCDGCGQCVDICPQHAIDVRGYADFAPPGHSVRVLREEEKGSISWRIKYRDGGVKEFTFPIRTTPWGSIKSPAGYALPGGDALGSALLAHEPEAHRVATLPVLPPAGNKQV